MLIIIEVTSVRSNQIPSCNDFNLFIGARLSSDPEPVLCPRRRCCGERELRDDAASLIARSTLTAAKDETPVAVA